MIVKPLDHIAMPGQIILAVITPADGDVVYLIIDGVRWELEFDSNAAVTGTRVAVPIGGSDAATAANAAAVIQTLIGDRVIIRIDGAYLDVRAKLPDTSLTGGTQSGLSILGPTHVAQRSLPTIMMMINREVFVIDVQRGKLVILLPIDNIAVVMVLFHESGDNNDIIQWTGNAIVSPGCVELINAPPRPFAVGDILWLIATGDRYE